MLEILPVNFPLKYPFKIARGTKYAARNVILSWKGDWGEAYGECAPNPRYNQTQEDAFDHFNHIKADLHRLDMNSMQAIDDFVQERYSKGGAYSAALEMLLLDAHAKLKKRPLYELLEVTHLKTPISSYTLGISSLDELKDKIEEATPYPILKVKLGTEDDLSIMKEIRKWTDKTIRVDANEGWKTVDNALKIADNLQKMGVELIEQPLHASQREELIAFKQQSPLPVCADESAEGNEDLSYLAEAFDIINIKLMKVGSILQGRRWLKEAKKKGLQIMVGCMLESPLAIMAGAMIAVDAEYCDLDGSILLRESAFEKTPFTKSWEVQLNPNPGLGVARIKAIEQYS